VITFNGEAVDLDLGALRGTADPASPQELLRELGRRAERGLGLCLYRTVTDVVTGYLWTTRVLP
jgi:hypothetical protein